MFIIIIIIFIINIIEVIAYGTCKNNVNCSTHLKCFKTT